MPLFQLLGLIPVGQPCADSGPWPCSEEGCPAPTISCAMLKANCDSTFADVWQKPPAGLSSVPVWQHCRATCNRCDGGGGGRGGSSGGESRCVKWRQTADCQPSGKRQPQSDQDCGRLIQNGWSGYCECSGGVRAGESACQHEPFKCEDKCQQQWDWLREQRAKRQRDKEAAGEAQEEAFSADGSLTKLYKRGKGFYVMGNTELALRHFREALKLDPEHKECKADYKQVRDRRLALGGGRGAGRGDEAIARDGRPALVRRAPSQLWPWRGGSDARRADAAAAG